jgi:hypothetical protein
MTVLEYDNAIKRQKGGYHLVTVACQEGTGCTFSVFHIEPWTLTIKGIGLTSLQKKRNGENIYSVFGEWGREGNSGVDEMLWWVWYVTVLHLTFGAQVTAISIPSLFPRQIMAVSKYP